MSHRRHLLTRIVAQRQLMGAGHPVQSLRTPCWVMRLYGSDKDIFKDKLGLFSVSPQRYMRNTAGDENDVKRQV